MRTRAIRDRALLACRSPSQCSRCVDPAARFAERRVTPTLAEGKIGPDELELFQVAGDPAEVLTIIKTAHAGMSLK